MKSIALRTSYFLAALIVLFVSGCSPDRASRPLPTPAAHKNPIEHLLNQAKTQGFPQAEASLLQAVHILINQGQHQRARQILGTINIPSLPPQLKYQAILATVKLAFWEQNPEFAVSILTTDRMGLQSINHELTTEQLNQLSLLRARAWEMVGNFLSAARERIFLAPLLEPPGSQANQEQIWTDLTALPIETLEALSQTAVFPETKGWLELAWIYKAFKDDLDHQLDLLNGWKERFSQHPAAINLPQSLAVLSQLANQRPTRVAVLLPQHGRYLAPSRAIRNGFIAAHFASINEKKATSDEPITIKFYDSSNTDTFLNTYQSAVSDGAQLIIGPLQKENVNQLQLAGNLAVPTLALNYSSDPLLKTENLYQFGLSAEDEARQVAERAALLGYTNAAVIYPQGSWGDRVFSAFDEKWQTLQGQTLASAQLNPKIGYSNTIKHMLLIEESEQRYRELRRITGMNFEYTPRRRHDIDFIYVVATPKQARQIKPLLAFHYAQSLPVLASSQIFSGETNPELDRDLEGIQFCDIPWFLAEHSTAKAKLKAAWPDANPKFRRFNALGVDAYRLLSRLQLLIAVPDAKLYGATGSLRLDPNHHILRELTWYKMSGGINTPLPPLTANPTEQGSPHEVEKNTPFNSGNPS